MGMAASQARFLGLTARKTNVEYAGQQINQARTALATESAGLFNDMMALKVPTPPVVSSYYDSRYNFTSATNTSYSISSLSETTNPSYPGGYDVSIKYTKNTLMGYKNTNQSLIECDDTDPSNPVYSYDGTTLKATTAADKSNLDAIRANEAFGFDASQEFLKYINPNDAAVIYYVAKPTQTQDYMTDMYYNANKTTNSVAKGIATLEKDESGRYTSAKLYEITPADAATDIGSGINYDLSITRDYDEEGYSAAMLDYDYNKNIYEKAVEDINAKTKQIQEQDRTLELKLRQLDTEQKALTTEMDSVQKVIQKNVEVTFKTFA